MKRYILKTFLFATAMGALVSCEEDTVTYGGTNFVTFNQVENLRFNFFENGGVANVPINLAFAKSNDVTVNFTVTSDVAVAGTHYNLITPGSVTIPAGQTTANIQIEVVNNDIQDDSKTLEINLTEISDSSVTVGLADQGSKFKRFLIINDDCTTNFLALFGDYDVKNAEGNIIGSANADVNENGDCNILRISGVLEDVLSNETDTFIEFTLAPGPGANGRNVGTLTAVQQSYCTDCFTANGVDQSFLYQGTGSFNATTQRMFLNGTLRTISSLYPNLPASVTLERKPQ